MYYYLTRNQDLHRGPEAARRACRQVPNPIFQAFGIAGLVVANAQLGDDEQAYYANQRLSTEMRMLLEQQTPRMSQLLNEALDELADRAL